jgi:hypothetical protein
MEGLKYGGLIDEGKFSWRLKIKADSSLRPGLQIDSQVPSASAVRIAKKSVYKSLYK